MGGAVRERRFSCPACRASFLLGDLETNPDMWDGSVAIEAVMEEMESDDDASDAASCGSDDDDDSDDDNDDDSDDDTTTTATTMTLHLSVAKRTRSSRE